MWGRPAGTPLGPGPLLGAAWGCPVAGQSKVRRDGVARAALGHELLHRVFAHDPSDVQLHRHCDPSPAVQAITTKRDTPEHSFDDVGGRLHPARRTRMQTPTHGKAEPPEVREQKLSHTRVFP